MYEIYHVNSIVGINRKGILFFKKCLTYTPPYLQKGGGGTLVSQPPLHLTF